GRTFIRLCRSFVLPGLSFYFALLFFQCYGAHRDLHSFPTRRSSDLCRAFVRPRRRMQRSSCVCPRTSACARSARRAHRSATPCRSEEHTSELQSHLNLVCRLLLEKKNTK